MEIKEYIPWVEKYRPNGFESIVLDDNNKTILSNIIDKKYTPNLLFYGPPGTGKTTTIINLINNLQNSYGIINKELMIHLNASDERGIDIIRNQINIFVNSKTLFNKGIKFVILDEVDYMTKNAQFALKYLLQDYPENIRFCLICNYISKIDDSLQSEFVKLRFNQLPKNKIFDFLENINIHENLKLSRKSIENIIYNYKSDIRSMINYMQSNLSCIAKIKVINIEVYENISLLIKEKNSKKFYNNIYSISQNYKIDIKSIFKMYINFIIKHKPEIITNKLLIIIETIIHNSDVNDNILINYIFYNFANIL